MKNKIEITVKNVYGVERIFPVNETALIFARIIGRKTFDEAHLSLIRSLGYVVEQVTEKMIRSESNVIGS